MAALVFASTLRPRMRWVSSGSSLGGAIGMQPPIPPQLPQPPQPPIMAIAPIRCICCIIAICCIIIICGFIMPPMPPIMPPQPMPPQPPMPGIMPPIIMPPIFGDPPPEAAPLPQAPPPPMPPQPPMQAPAPAGQPVEDEAADCRRAGLRLLSRPPASPSRASICCCREAEVCFSTSLRAPSSSSDIAPPHWRPRLRRCGCFRCQPWVLGRRRAEAGGVG
mmetsp:Transcript_139618/g.445570  ORF Transcript_139618/g.445570 Transcript_139618/m.445570 type:complete len:220 (-) Transcript_139618:13-672(-)